MSVHYICIDWPVESLHSGGFQGKCTMNALTRKHLSTPAKLLIHRNTVRPTKLACPSAAIAMIGEWQEAV
eukprot:568457-Ditylum_brightwellii.AAC.1